MDTSPPVDWKHRRRYWRDHCWNPLRVERQAIKLPHLGWAMRTGLTAIAIGLFLLCLPKLTLQAASAVQGSAKAGVVLQAWLERDSGHFDSHPQLMLAMVRFYEARQFQPACMGPKALTPQGSKALKTLLSACNERTPKLAAYVRQLVSNTMDATQFIARGAAIPLEALLQVEVGIAQIALYFATQFDPDFLPPDKSGWSPQQQIAAKLAKTLDGPTWGALRNAACPRQKPYQALQKSLERYRSIELLGGWPSIPEGPQLRAGVVDSRVPLLRRRLIVSGDLRQGWLSKDETFDELLERRCRFA